MDLPLTDWGAMPAATGAVFGDLAPFRILLIAAALGWATQAATEAPLAVFCLRVSAVVDQPADDFHMAQAAGIVQGSGAVGIGDDCVDGGAVGDARQNAQQALLVGFLHGIRVLRAAQLGNQLVELGICQYCTLQKHTTHDEGYETTKRFHAAS